MRSYSGCGYEPHPLEQALGTLYSTCKKGGSPTFVVDYVVGDLVFRSYAVTSGGGMWGGGGSNTSNV